jgi:hypothetical protein
MQSPFKLVPASEIANIADKFTTSQILSPNELRAIVGFKPVDDPKADELRNAHLNESADAPPPASTNPDQGTSEERASLNGQNPNGLPPEVLEFVRRLSDQNNQNEGGNG